MLKEFTIEELKTAIGLLMLDLRGNWADLYAERMDELMNMLIFLIEKEDNTDYKKDLKITLNERIEPEDGRIFRDMCSLYGYSSEEGKTQRVKEYLDEVMTYPDSNNFKLN